MDKKVEEMGLHAAGVHVGPLDSRPARLFVALASFLAVNAMIAEFVGVKIFALEPSLGVAPFNWNLFGQNGSLSFTSGVLLWPFVFLMTDVINEYFGRRGVQFISWLTVVLISYGFLTAYLAIALTPAGWWVTVNQRSGVPNMQAAFASIFGQGMWTIGGERKVWLRATGSTLVSQFIDSFVVLYIAFVIGPQHWPMGLFLAVGTVNYCYKLLMAFLLIPLIYLVRRLIYAYLGEKTAAAMEDAARQV
jgi:uncharacterized PurR-regulated membrane protein YhhQ (DUF165 family)